MLNGKKKFIIVLAALITLPFISIDRVNALVTIVSVYFSGQTVIDSLKAKVKK